jgi:hypothetical protein
MLRLSSKSQWKIPGLFSFKGFSIRTSSCSLRPRKKASLRNSKAVLQTSGSYSMALVPQIPNSFTNRLPKKASTFVTAILECGARPYTSLRKAHTPMLMPID